MSDWQQYDYDKDGYLESGKELSDYNAAEQKESKEWLQEFNEDSNQLQGAFGELQTEFDKVALQQFWDATQYGAHFLMEAGQALSDTALLVARAAEVIDWLGSAFKWFGYIVPGAGAIADLLERVENVSEEKALKAQFVALGVTLDGLYLASAGWDAMMAGRVTDEAVAKARSVIDRAVEIGQGITDVLFD